MDLNKGYRRAPEAIYTTCQVSSFMLRWTISFRSSHELIDLHVQPPRSEGCLSHSTTACDCRGRLTENVAALGHAHLSSQALGAKLQEGASAGRGRHGIRCTPLTLPFAMQPGPPPSTAGRPLSPRQLAHFELAGVVLRGQVRHVLQQDVGDAQPLQQAGRPVGGLVGQFLEGILGCSSDS